VRVTPAAYFVKEPSSSGLEPGRDPSESVSIPALSGAAQAASHPSVKHITDTLVRMGYFLDDLQNGVFLLRDPLGDEIMGRRNKVAKHNKCRADAEEAMLVLCREGKVDEISVGLFRILHFEGEEEPAGRTKASSGSGDSQPPKMKPKTSQDKPKVRKSVSSEPAHSELVRRQEPQSASSIGGAASNSVCKSGNRSSQGPENRQQWPKPCLSY
jgi:hypothetical protein